MCSWVKSDSDCRPPSGQYIHRGLQGKSQEGGLLGDEGRMSLDRGSDSQQR